MNFKSAGEEVCSKKGILEGRDYTLGKKEKGRLGFTVE